MGPGLPTLFVFVTVVLNAMGVGLIVPVTPALIEAVRGVELAEAAVWGGVLAAVFAVMQFLFSPLMGNLSDRFGRRPVLLASLAVMAVDYVIMALAQTIWLLVAGRIVSGLAAATIAVAYAMIADLHPPRERAARFGLIAAGFGIGFVLGPALGGLLGQLDARAPFWGAAALTATNLAFGTLVVTETLADANRRPFCLARANPLGGLAQMRRLPGMGRLLAVMLLFHVASWVYPAVWAFYTQARFDFDTGQVGLSLAVYGLGLFAVQAILIRPIIVLLGEHGTIYAAGLLAIGGLVWLGLITEAWMLWAILPVLALTDLFEPALQGVMSGRAAADQQGELQGVQGSLQALAAIVSPLVMTQIFWGSTREGAAIHAPGAPFLFAALLMALCVGLFALGPRRAGRAGPAGVP